MQTSGSFAALLDDTLLVSKDSNDVENLSLILYFLHTHTHTYIHFDYLNILYVDSIIL